MCLLLLEAGVERELARHGQHEDREHDPVLADQLRRAREGRGAHVVAEDRDQRRAVLELLEVGWALVARSARGRAQVEALLLAVGDVQPHAEAQPRHAGDSDGEMQDRHGHEREARSADAQQREHGERAAGDPEGAGPSVRARLVRAGGSPTGARS